MKISKYISIFEDEMMIYNALNSSLVRLNPNLFKIFKDRDLKDDIINQYPNEIEELKKGMFLLDKDFDELQYIKFAHTLEKFRQNNLNLTIAPTLNCNFNCYYCVQDVNLKKDNSDMTMETADNIIKFIKANHEKYKLNSLNITWYGGEPLLKFDVIEYLSNQIKELTINDNIVYNASIITNGYLLNYDYAEFLSKNNVETVQVTIDGPEEIHNKRRRHKDNLGTYKVIIENIKNVAGLFKNILIRFNVDKTNIQYLDNLVSEINSEFDELNNVILYISPVVSDTLDNCNFSNNLYSYQEFSKIQYQNRVVVPSNLYPKNLYGSCGATQINSFVITPSGDICKCWNEVSDKNKSISTLEGPITNMSRFVKWISYDPTEIEKCVNCEVLPICMGGGCPYRVLFPNDSGTEIECNEYKYFLKEYILGWLELAQYNKEVTTS